MSEQRTLEDVDADLKELYKQLKILGDSMIPKVFNILERLKIIEDKIK